MKFSIVLPSRERPQLLTNLAQSIQDTTTDISNVELLVGIDDDDNSTHEIVLDLKVKFPFMKIFSRPRSEWLNRDYHNWLYFNFANHPDYIIAANDDCEFQSPNWDKIAEEKIEEYLKDKPDRIMYAFVHDNLPQRFGMNYSCFPMVSKEGVKALGFVLNNEFRSWVSDQIVWQLYHSIGRTTDSQILVAHLSYHCNGIRERDSTSHHVEMLHNLGHEPVPFDYYKSLLQQAIEMKKLELQHKSLMRK